MSNKKLFGVKQLILLIFTQSILLSCNNKENKLVLFDFENIAQKDFIKPQDATYDFISTEDNNFIKVNSGFSSKEPGVKLLPPKNQPWDLSKYYQIQADIKNVGNKDIQVEMFVGNDPNLLLRWFCSDYVDLKPGESATIVVNLAWTPWINDPKIEFQGMNGAPGKIKADLTKVSEITFCSRYATETNNFTVDNVIAVGKYELRSSADFFPFVDEFGQYIHKEWEGKMHSIDEIKKVGNNQLTALRNSKGAPNIGKYGGWTAGPQFEVTGFFRTEKIDGKWWMVDPEGFLFWSAGVNCMASNSVFTGITDRENYFSSLPKKDSELAKFYSNERIAPHGFYANKTPYRAYNFYQSNLYRKYGENWLSTFREMIHLRLKNWGLNTIGFMSDFGATIMNKTPYVGSIWINNTPKIEGTSGYWGPFHDVFDPKFREAVKNSIALQKDGANDPWCIGYFIDNELSWGLTGSLTEGTLRSPKTQPAKIELIKDLSIKYKKIDALNEVWETNFENWDEFLSATNFSYSENAKEDLVDFYKKIADTYFKIINEEIKNVAPNQNYLGCRFAWANNDVVLTAASKYLDIMSFNKYENSIENFMLPKGIDKPIIIGEFHFGSTDYGSFHPGVKAVNNQNDRGEMYKSYIEGSLRNPNIVGAHWFQYIDEPITGRFDGENYNVGFVDVCDNPYTELIKKVKETTYNMYSYRTEHDNKNSNY